MIPHWRVACAGCGHVRAVHVGEQGEQHCALPGCACRQWTEEPPTDEGDSA